MKFTQKVTQKIHICMYLNNVTNYWNGCVEIAGDEEMVERLLDGGAQIVP